MKHPRLRKFVFWSAVAVAISWVSHSAYTLGPLPASSRSYVRNGVRIDEKLKRECTLLPLREWGLNKERFLGCGGGIDSLSITTRKIGFVAVIDTMERVGQKLTQRPR
jgi:hypothetical protein